MTHSPDFPDSDAGANADPSESTEHDSTRPDWERTESALDKFLDCLSHDREEAGKKYVALQTRLVRFFEWRGCDSPEARADDTIDRVIRKIDEGKIISNLTPYILTVARLVAMEDWKIRKRMRSLDSDMPGIPHPSIPNQMPKVESEDQDPRLTCFDHCLESLEQENRDLILGYYQEDGHAKIVWRKQLAGQLGIPLNALRIRAHRIRKTLEQCIEDCLTQFA